MTIKEKIKKMANAIRDKIRLKEFFESEQVKKLLETYAATMYGGDIELQMVDDQMICDTACTDGQFMILNWNSPLITFFATLKDRFIAFLGLFFHELSHILYNDFDTCNRIMKKLENGMPVGEDPVLPDDSIWQEVKDALADEKMRRIILALYRGFNNTVIDQHDEEKLIAEYGGIPKEAIVKVREALRAESVSLDFLEDQLAKGKITEVEALDSMVLEFIRFGRVLVIDGELEQKSELLKLLQSVSAHAEMARWTDSARIRFNELNYLIAALWPYIKEELNHHNHQEEQKGEGQQSKEQSQSQTGQNSGQGQSHSQQPSDTKINDLAKKLQEIADKMAAGNAPEGSSSKKAKENAKLADQGKQKAAGVAAQNASKAEEMIAQQMEQTLTDISQSMAVSALEKEAEKAQRKEAKNVMSESSSHKNVPVRYTIGRPATDPEKKRYREFQEEINGYVKKLKKEFLQQIHDVQSGDTLRHRSFGKELNPRDFGDAAERYFQNKKAPKDFPDMVISVLIDNSGSMIGTRNEQSIKAAVLLLEFARGIGIPIQIAGHHTNGNTVMYDTMAGFEGINPDDKYRILQLWASGCNRDGAALLISLDALKKRPEKTKLLLVISDGRPNHEGYRGEDACEDIRKILKKARHSGVEVYGCAIGDDKEIIKSIYGNGFLDISELALLPKKLTGLVARTISSQI